MLKQNVYVVDKLNKELNGLNANSMFLTRGYGKQCYQLIIC